MTSSPPKENLCPWCDKPIQQNKKGLIPLTIHLTKHTRTELSILLIDWMVNGIPKRDKLK